jgi:hypothetical protein
MLITCAIVAAAARKMFILRIVPENFLFFCRFPRLKAGVCKVMP